MDVLAEACVHVRDRIAKQRGQAIGEENTKHALMESCCAVLGAESGPETGRRRR